MERDKNREIVGIDATKVAIKVEVALSNWR